MRTIYAKLTLLVCLIFSISITAQQTDIKNEDKKSQVTSSKGKFLGKSSPLRELSKKVPADSGTYAKKKDLKQKLKEIPNFPSKKAMTLKTEGEFFPKNGDPLAKKNQLNKNPFGEVQELLVLDGIGFNEAQIWPPDVNGDIGLDYYLQGVNGSPSSLIYVFDKITGEKVDSIVTSLIWDEVGASVVGDIIILFDRFIDRWIISEISFSSMTIAMSETSDPLGAYNIYEFVLGGLPDYPKFAAWEDAIYVTTNEFNGFNPVYAFDKDDLATGAATVDFVIYENIPKLDEYGFSFEVNAPVDFSGVNLPGDTPLMAIRMVDDQLADNDFDGLEYYTFETNFDDSDLSEIQGPFTIELAPFESTLCAFGIFDCLEQQDGYDIIDNDTVFFTAPLLSALQHTIMNRPQYRRFTDYESIVLNFSVDVTGTDVAGIRWVELRKTGAETEWSLYQEGTHSVPDGQNRWMASIAQDGNANTFMVYTVGGPDVYNSIAYTARRNADDLGQMTFGETIMTEGANAHPNARWGDYFAVKTDPQNELELWFTAEYVPADEDWATKVAKVTLRQDTIDGAFAAFAAPLSINNLTGNESVEIVIANPGIDTIENISWSVSFEGSEIETGVYEGKIASGESVNIPLTATVNMAALGEYDFSGFISVADDQFLPNDTLSVTRTHLPSFDLTTTAILPSNDVCVELVTVVGRYTNLGLDTITSFDATVSVGGVLQSTVPFSGVLLPNQSVDIEFVDIPIAIGVNNLDFTFENLNGTNADQVTDNDSDSGEVTSIGDAVELILDFQTDFYANEVSWEIVDEDNDILFEGGGYPGGGPTQQTYEFCVAEGCYTFNLYDSFGDGWGGDPSAYLEIQQVGGPLVVILDNTSFGDFWTTNFCVPKDCGALEVEVEYEDASGPDVNDAAIFINFPGAGPNAMYSIDGGVTLQDSPLFINLVPGEYEIYVDDGLGCTYTETISILVPTIAYPEAEFIVSPNPTDGVFTVELKGYDGPQELMCNIVNSEGKLVGNYIINKFSTGYKRVLLTPDLPAGIYYLSIQNDDFNQLKKIIKK